MAKRRKTAQLILDAALRLFNQQGYAATTTGQIARAIGISQGNLTYHFRTKRDLVTGIQARVGALIQARRAAHVPGDVADDYVGRLLFAMALTAEYRFLLRDDAQLGEGPDHQRPHRVLVEDYAALRAQIDRIAAAGGFRPELAVDLSVLTTALWILSRHWMDYLTEMELIDEPDRAAQLRGVEHHFALLLPNLVPAMRARFEAALTQAAAA